MKPFKEIFSAVIGVLALLLPGCTTIRYSYPDPGIRVENLEDTVRFLSTISPPRGYDHPDSLKRAAGFIARKFAEYGMEPTEQAFIVDGVSYVNVVAGAGPRGGSVLIVGAHYDVSGDQPGADDNASAVAGLLEVARFAKKHEADLPYRVEFVAFALEEPPFFGTAKMGSYVHAESLKRNNVAVKGMICLEMIGFFTDEKKSQDYPLSLLHLFYPDTGNFIAVVGNYAGSSLVSQVARHLEAASINVSSLKAPSFVTGVDFSDHRNYWKFGFDAVMVTDTAFYRNPNYHERTDTIGTLDFKRMCDVVKGVCWAILNMK
jgi:hypothetical protein